MQALYPLVLCHPVQLESFPGSPPFPAAEELRRVERVCTGWQADSRGLLRQVERGKETLLIIDEAQDLTDDLLEQVRLLIFGGEAGPPRNGPDGVDLVESGGRPIKASMNAHSWR